MYWLYVSYCFDNVTDVILFMAHHGLCMNIQTSQLSRFGRETYDFSTDLMIACQSHDLAEILLSTLNIICVSRDHK